MYFFRVVLCIFLGFSGTIYVYAQDNNALLAKQWDSKMQELYFAQKEDDFEGWTLDSLERVLPFLKNPKTKCDWLNLIAERYFTKSLPKVHNLLELAYQIAQKENYIFGEYWSERSFAIFYQKKGEISKSLHFLGLCEENAKKIQYQHGVATAYSLRGGTYEKQEKPVLALQAFLKSIEIHEKIQNNTWLALDYWRIAIFYYKREDYKRGIVACEKGEFYGQKSKNKKALIRIYNWHGLILEKQAQQEKAIEYFNKSWQLLQKYTYPTSDNERAMSLYGIGSNKASMFYKNPKDTFLSNSALEYLDLCVNFQKQKFGTVDANTYLKIAELYTFLDKKDLAEETHIQAQKSAWQRNDFFEIANIEEHLAKFYFKQKKYVLAQNICKNIIKYAKNKDLQKYTLTAYNILAEIEAQNQNFQQAFAYQQQAQNIQQALNTDRDQRKVARIEIEYELSQTQKEKDIQTQKIQILQNAEINYQKNLNYLVIVAFVVSLLLGVLALFYYQKQKNINKLLYNQTTEINKKNSQIEVHKQILEKAYLKSQKTNEQLTNLNNTIQSQKEELQINTDTLYELNNELIKSQQEVVAMNSNLELMIQERTQSLTEITNKLLESNTELETFLYHSSHDLRRPLTTIMGLKNIADILLEDATLQNLNELKKEISILFGHADETARNMDKMLMKLVMIHEVAKYQCGKNLEEIDFDDMIKQIQKKHVYFVMQKNLIWEVKIQPNMQYIGEERLIMIILENILENAVDFANNLHPLVLVKIELEETKLKIMVSDNGQGIDTNNQHNIFNLYFRGNEKSKGNGLGLYVVKKVVEKLHGKISFRSQPHVGTTFVVEI